ncbi:MAG: glycosyl transferase family 2 [uncultured bacterium]|nr:MAG: glycosyl transferase family 2 [uncultured bacterium]
MKIGIFDPYLDDLGGGEKYMLTLASCLSKNNDVNLFWDKKEDLDIVTERFSIDMSKVNVVKNIFNKNYGFLNRLRESKKYDSIIVLSDGSIPWVLSKKLFLHIQQPIPSVSYSLKDSIKIGKVTKVFCNSTFTQSFLDKKLKNKSIVIYPPIELKPRDIKKENIILSVGRFRVKNVGMPDYKKQSVLVDVFSKMYDEGLRDWKLILATSVKKDEEEEFEKLREKARGKPIEFLVNKKNDELWDIYSQAKIYWHATGFGEDLVSRPDFAEHFGISTVEAMGGGAVPVVINAGGQKEIIDDCVDGFLWEDLDGLIKNTLFLINNPEKLEKMSKKSKSKAQKFAEKDFCKEVQSLVVND